MCISLVYIVQLHYNAQCQKRKNKIMYYHTENAAVVPKLKIRQMNHANRSVNCVSVLFLYSSR